LPGIDTGFKARIARFNSQGGRGRAAQSSSSACSTDGNNLRHRPEQRPDPGPEGNHVFAVAPVGSQVLNPSVDPAVRPETRRRTSAGASPPRSAAQHWGFPHRRVAKRRPPGRTPSGYTQAAQGDRHVAQGAQGGGDRGTDKRGGQGGAPRASSRPSRRPAPTSSTARRPFPRPGATDYTRPNVQALPGQQPGHSSSSWSNFTSANRPDRGAAARPATRVPSGTRRHTCPDSWPRSRSWPRRSPRLPGRSPTSPPAEDGSAAARPGWRPT